MQIINTKKEFPISDKLLLTDLLEISDLLIQNKKIRFRCRGWCMFPEFKNGDIIEFEPSGIKNLNIGDGCLFYQDGKLFCHKVTEINRGAEGAFVINQQDGLQNPVYSYQILGRATAVIRKGKLISYAASCELSQPARDLDYQLFIFRNCCKQVLFKIIRKIQALSFYKPLGAVILKNRRYYLGPVNDDKFYSKPFNYVEISLKSDFKKILPKFNSFKIFHIMTKINNMPAGRLVTIKQNGLLNADTQWKVFQNNVRWRFRGLGIEEEALKIAMRIISEG